MPATIININKYKAEKSGEIHLKKLIQKYDLNSLAQEKLEETLNLLGQRIGKKFKLI